MWAEIFEVQCDGEEMYWARVSDDVVPVNITCIQDTPETVFQITAYNRHVEKIFDVRLIQPGMSLRFIYELLGCKYTLWILIGVILHPIWSGVEWSGKDNYITQNGNRYGYAWTP